MTEYPESREEVPDGGGTARDGHRWGHRLACAALATLLGVVYLVTLYPGVSKGDAAELQYMCPLLGVCHPPGYVVELSQHSIPEILLVGFGHSKTGTGFQKRFFNLLVHRFLLVTPRSTL